MATRKEIQTSINKRNYQGSALTVDPKSGLRYPVKQDTYINVKNYPRPYNPIGTQQRYAQKQYLYQQRQKDIVPLVSDYNDPMAINSMADVILASLNPDWGGNLFQNIGTYWQNTIINPLSKGEWGAFGINRLIDFGETMDIVANPVKGLILEGTEGFKKSLGIGYSGRYNYDYDTGNIITDLTLELLSDPLNWVTFFGKAAATAVNIGDVQKVIKTFIGDTGNEVADKSLRKVARNALNAFWAGDTTELADAIYKAMKANKATQLFTSTNFEEVVQGVQRLHDIVVDNTSLQTLKGLQRIITPVEKFESYLLKTALTGGAAPVLDLIGKGKAEIAEFIGRRLRQGYQPYVKPDGKLSFLDYPKLKEIAENKQLDVMSAMRLMKDGTIPPNTLHDLLRDSFHTDMYIMRQIILKYWNDPTKILHEVNNYYRTIRGTDALQYLNSIAEVNKQTDGAFSDIYDMFLTQLEDIELRVDAGVSASISKVIAEKEKMIILYKDALKEKFQDAPTIQQFKTFKGAEASRQGAVELVTSFFETLKEIKQSISVEKAHNESFLWYNQALQELDDLIETIRIEYLAPIQNSVDSGKPVKFKDFTNINAIERFEIWAEKWVTKAKQDIEGLQDAYTGHSTFETIEKWMDHAVKNQSPLLEDIAQTQLKSMKASKTLTSQFTSNFKSVKKDIYNIFKNDIVLVRAKCDSKL